MTKDEIQSNASLALLAGGISTVLISIVWAGFWCGLTLSVLWGWFVVPVFGLPALTILQAYGLILVLASQRHVSKQAESNEGFSAVMVRAFLLPPTTCGSLLGIGFIAKSFA